MNTYARTLAQVVIMAAYLGAIAVQPRQNPIVTLVVLIVLVPPFARTVHELGHAACCAVFKVEISSISIAVLPGSIGFSLGKVPVKLGYAGGSRVMHGPVASPVRSAALAAAGPAANLLAAGVAMAVGEVLTSLTGQRFAFGIAMISACYAVASLIPYRSTRGTLSDGASVFRRLTMGKAATEVSRLLADPDVPGRVDDVRRLFSAYQRGVPAARAHFAALAVLLRRSGLIDELLELHASLRVPSSAPSAATTGLALAFNSVECTVLAVPGLPANAVSGSAERVEWVIGHYTEKDESWPAIVHTLALVRMRQGRLEEVEPLCLRSLETTLAPADRATVLATIALARQALGRPCRELAAEAVALAPDADLVQEAAAQVSGDPPAVPPPAG